MSTPLDMLLEQVVAQAWIRCIIEEGVDFKNKKTGRVERSEQIIYESFQKNLGFFDLPAAKGSKYGIEKNILEVIGGYLVFSQEPNIIQMLASSTFKQKVQQKLKEILA